MEILRQESGADGFVMCVGLPLTQVAEIAKLLRDETVVMAAAGPEGAIDLLQGAERGSERRPSGSATTQQIGALRLDFAMREVTVDGVPVHTSTREFDLLTVMASEVGRVWSFQELTARVWRTGYLGDPDPVVSAVKRLRKRLAQVPSVEIASVRGIGYRVLVSTASDNDVSHPDDARSEPPGLRVLPQQTVAPVEESMVNQKTGTG